MSSGPCHTFPHTLARRPPRQHSQPSRHLQHVPGSGGRRRCCHSPGADSRLTAAEAAGDQDLSTGPHGLRRGSRLPRVQTGVAGPRRGGWSPSVSQSTRGLPQPSPLQKTRGHFLVKVRMWVNVTPRVVRRNAVLPGPFPANLNIYTSTLTSCLLSSVFTQDK